MNATTTWMTLYTVFGIITGLQIFTHVVYLIRGQFPVVHTLKRGTAVFELLANIVIMLGVLNALELCRNYQQ